jgi:O-antigen/teichoic acid export membrane protein
VAGRAGDALLRFGLFLGTAAVLNAREFSVYALLTAALGTAQGAGGLGATRVATYFHSRTSPDALVGWLITLAVLPSGLVIAALGFSFLRTSLFPAVPGALVILGLSPLPAILLADSLSAILLARRREKLYSALLWARSGATGVVLATSLMAPDRLRWLLAGRLVTALLLLIPHFRALRLEGHLRGTFELAYPAFRFGLPVAGAGAVGALHRRADVFLLSALGRTLEIGAYAIAYVLAEAFWTITDSLEAALFVRLSRQNDEAARTEVRRAAGLYAGIAAAGLVLGMGGGTVILRLGFGHRHPAAAALFPWLLVAAVAWGFSRPFSSYLYSRGRGNQVFLAHVACLALNIVLCLLWIPAWGAAGAARATLASYGIDMLVLLLLARRRAAAPSYP